MSKHHFSKTAKALLKPEVNPEAPVLVPAGEPLPAPDPGPELVTSEAIDLVLRDGKWLVLAVEHAAGLSEERVLFSSFAGPEAASKFVEAAKKKCLRAVGVDLGADASRL